jgi:hypothetical protein
MWGFPKHLLLAALGSTLSAVSAYADLGWSLAQTSRAYGEPTAGPLENGSVTRYQFKAQRYTITAGYLHGLLGEITYERQAALDEPAINFFKARNCPDTKWLLAFEEGLGGYWSGLVDGKEAYRAVLSDDHTTLTIITDEYRGRIMFQDFMGWITR